MNHRQNQFDVIGVGFGPANISLAIAMEEAGLPYRVKFFEKEPEETAVWQKEMLIEHSDIQNHPLRDLVTPRNPRSKYTFVNYLFENKRLFEHLNLGMNYPYRLEYAQYIFWVAKHFRSLVNYNCSVEQIMLESGGPARNEVFCIKDKLGNEYRSPCLIVAPGRTPYIPEVFQTIPVTHVCHLVNYLQSVKALVERNKSPRICVVGGSQSAVEIILHLSDYCPGAKITGVLRSFGYRLKDSSPFTGEVYFPDFIDFYYSSTPAEKRRLTKDLYYTNYSAVDGDILDKLYRKLYMQKLTGDEQIQIHRLAEILEAGVADKSVEIAFKKLEIPDLIRQKFDLVILATGFKNLGTAENEERYPGVLQGLAPFLQFDEHYGMQIDPDYKIATNEKTAGDAVCYLNGLCESTHGMGDAGSLSLLALRSQVIVESLHKHLSVRMNEHNNVQSFFQL